jgi:hypothetical protein
MTRRVWAYGLRASGLDSVSVLVRIASESHKPMSSIILLEEWSWTDLYREGTALRNECRSGRLSVNGKW